jgi:hypothetical protein
MRNSFFSRFTLSFDMGGGISVRIGENKNLNGMGSLPFLSVIGVDGGVGGGLLLPAFGGGKRLSDGLGGASARCCCWPLLKLFVTSNSLLIFTPESPLSGFEAESRPPGDGGVVGGGLLNMPQPSAPPRASNTPPSCCCCGGGEGSSYSSLRTTPDDDVDDDEEETPAPVDTPPVGGGVGGVDDESKKLKLKSEVVSKLTSVVTWWWRLDSVTREPEPNPPIDWSILNTSISPAFFFTFLLQSAKVHKNVLGLSGPMFRLSINKIKKKMGGG